MSTARPFTTRSARRRRVGASLVAGSLLAAGALGSFPALAAGNSGRIHVRTSATDSGNTPKPPCVFYVDFDQFPKATELPLRIYKEVASGDLVLFHTDEIATDADGERSIKVSLSSTTVNAELIRAIQVDYGNKQKNISTLA